MRPALFSLLFCSISIAVQAQSRPAPVRPGSSPQAANPDPETPRPIAAVDTIFIEEMTWLEVRDAMRAGKTTAIVATGGVEMNGPYLVTGKHDVVLRATTEAIARRLGDALVAPIIPFVPEGEIDPPSGMMRYPGTISLSAATYKALLTDVVSSLRAHGFRNVVLIGDSGGNQAGMKEVAAELDARWAGGKTRVLFIPEYYDYPGLSKWIEGQGVREVDEGIHDDYGITTMMMTVDPKSVRIDERAARGKASINGVSLLPVEQAVAFGRRAVDFRAEQTVVAIRKAIGR
jgi:creatinine amidohydrolase/Fe(II)-dependent formamide hydrolase-like protein